MHQPPPTLPLNQVLPERFRTAFLSEEGLSAIANPSFSPCHSLSFNPYFPSDRRAKLLLADSSSLPQAGSSPHFFSFMRPPPPPSPPFFFPSLFHRTGVDTSRCGSPPLPPSNSFLKRSWMFSNRVTLEVGAVFSGLPSSPLSARNCSPRWPLVRQG